MKPALLLIVLLSIQAQAADFKAFGDLRLGRDAAKEYCKKQNMRMPTALEVAAMAQTLGATGLSRQGDAVTGTDEDGSSVVFYFDNDGFTLNSDVVSGLQEEASYWTATKAYNGKPLAYDISIWEGGFNIYLGTEANVLCIR